MIQTTISEENTCVTLFITDVSTFSQLNFENLSFAEALQKAKQTGKLIFLQFESIGCNQCNDVASKAFEDKGLSKTLEETFICIKITSYSPDRIAVANRYNKKDEDFGSMFINQDGTLVHHYPGSTTAPKTYQDHVDKALTKAGEGMRVNDLEKQYKDGNKSPGFMELLMETKRSLNLETDSLLEEYISLLPADSFKSARTIAFIAGMAPIIDSKASLIMRKDYPLFLTAWQTMPEYTRPYSNNMTVHKSMKKAIAEKNEPYAYKSATYAGSIYGNKNPGTPRKPMSRICLIFTGKQAILPILTACCALL